MIDQENCWLFVYGPYMNPKYLSQHHIGYHSSRKAVLLDYDICFSSKTDNWKHAMIDIVEKEGHRLEGVAYEIDSNALQVLDHLEKVLEGKHKRIAVNVLTDSGRRIKACTYICPTKEGRFRPSMEYIDLIIEGARLNCLSEEHVQHIRSFREATEQDNE